jgi:hypothetical protein
MMRNPVSEEQGKMYFFALDQRTAQHLNDMLRFSGEQSGTHCRF